MSNAVNRTHLASLRAKVQEMSSSKGSFQKKDDERYWKPELDKAGLGSAVIRFLPAKTGESFPFVELQTHGFQGPTNKWFIDNCPSSLGGLPSDVCPVCAGNNVLWNADKDKESPLKKLASSRKRKLSYISNVLVVNDPKHPENNGKVFLYRYGKKIFEKMKDLIDPPPEFADLEPIDPFNPEFGTNFKLRITKQDNFPNYDKSTFDTAASSIGDENRIAEVLGQMYSLTAILDVKNFKSFDALAKRFTMVTGEGEAPATPAEASTGANLDTPLPPAATEKPAVPQAAAAPATPAPAATKKTTTAKAAVADESADQDDDFFANLAKKPA